MSSGKNLGKLRWSNRVRLLLRMGISLSGMEGSLLRRISAIVINGLWMILLRSTSVIEWARRWTTAANEALRPNAQTQAANNPNPSTPAANPNTRSSRPTAAPSPRPVSASCQWAKTKCSTNSSPSKSKNKAIATRTSISSTKNRLRISSLSMSSIRRQALRIGRLDRGLMLRFRILGNGMLWCLFRVVWRLGGRRWRSLIICCRRFRLSVRRRRGWLIGRIGGCIWWRLIRRIWRICTISRGRSRWIRSRELPTGC